MKNKLYISLLILVSGITVASNNLPDAIAANQKDHWSNKVPNYSKVVKHDKIGTLGATHSSATNQAPNWSEIVKHDKAGTLGATHSSVLGGSTSSYASSYLENILRHIADGLSKLRQQDPKIFNKFFSFK